jgi:hypothetical protein
MKCREDGRFYGPLKETESMATTVTGCREDGKNYGPRYPVYLDEFRRPCKSQPGKALLRRDRATGWREVPTPLAQFLGERKNENLAFNVKN